MVLLFSGKMLSRQPSAFLNGYGRVAVASSVRLEHSDERGRWVKEGRGYTSEWTSKEKDGGDDGLHPMTVDWKGPPDHQVKYMPTFRRMQSWLPWNEFWVVV